MVSTDPRIITRLIVPDPVIEVATECRLVCSRIIPTDLAQLSIRDIELNIQRLGLLTTAVPVPKPAILRHHPGLTAGEHADSQL